MLSAALPCVDEFSLMADVVQYLCVQVKVIDDHLRLLKTLQSLYSKQAYISWTCSDYIYFAFFH